MKRFFILWFSGVLAVMLALTVWASLQSNVVQGYLEVAGTRWGLATLGDAYFAFSLFYFWVAYLHPSWPARLLWFLLVMALGNFAIAGFCLWRVARWDENQGAGSLLLRT